MCFQDDQLCPAKHLLQLYWSLSTCYTLLMPRLTASRNLVFLDWLQTCRYPEDHWDPVCGLCAGHGGGAELEWPAAQEAGAHPGRGQPVGHVHPCSVGVHGEEGKGGSPALFGFRIPKAVIILEGKWGKRTQNVIRVTELSCSEDWMKMLHVECLEHVQRLTSAQ